MYSSVAHYVLSNMQCFWEFLGPKYLPLFALRSLDRDSRKEERGKRKEERGKRKEERTLLLCPWLAIFLRLYLLRNSQSEPPSQVVIGGIYFLTIVLSAGLPFLFFEISVRISATTPWVCNCGQRCRLARPLIYRPFIDWRNKRR